MKTLRSTRQQGAGGWKKLYSEQLHGLLLLNNYHSSDYAEENYMG
jgi:hypothetical protein